MTGVLSCGLSSRRRRGLENVDTVHSGIYYAKCVRVVGASVVAAKELFGNKVAIPNPRPELLNEMV